MTKFCTTFLLVICSLCLNAQLSVPETPSLFLEGIVSTELNERDMAISPDGSEMYYTLQANHNALSTIIGRKRMSNNKWSDPFVASFSGRYADLEPAFSPDGKKLYFSSNRPTSGQQAKDYDIWVVEKINGNWSAPHNLGSPVNTNANEFYPSSTTSGNLYFTAEYEDKGVGKEDIYVSRWVNGNFTNAIPLDTAVNSKMWEFNAFVPADETYVLFTSYGRKDDKGGGDLYVSLKDKDGTWLPAKNLALVNSNKLDYCPFVTPDQKTFFFTSGRHNLSAYDKTRTFEELSRIYNSTANGSENIYWMSFPKLLESVK